MSLFFLQHNVRYTCALAVLQLEKLPANFGVQEKKISGLHVWWFCVQCSNQTCITYKYLIQILLCVGEKCFFPKVFYGQFSEFQIILLSLGKDKDDVSSYTCWQNFEETLCVSSGQWWPGWLCMMTQQVPGGVGWFCVGKWVNLLFGTHSLFTLPSLLLTPDS